MDARTVLREGMRVRWVPTEAAGDADHPLCQDGTVVRFDALRVIVRFDSATDREVAVNARTLRVL